MRLRAMIAMSTMWLGTACGGGATTEATDTAAPAEPVSSGDERPTGERDERPAAGASSGTTAATSNPAEAPEWTSERNPNARVIVAIGNPIARDDSVEPEHLRHARRHAAESVRAVDGVELAPPHFDHTDFERHLAGRTLRGMFLECAIVRHDVDARGTHFAVSITVVELGTEDVLATLQGRATAPGPTGDESEELALEGALDSALRGLPQLIVALD